MRLLIASMAALAAVAFAAPIITVLAVLTPTAFGEALVQRKLLGRDHLDTLFWLTLIHMTFVFSGVLMALMDWLQARSNK